jgi:hypothetical protein
MKKSRDVKFVIYQVLYIFVICVIALKGADINLEEVISKENVVEKTFADSLKKYIDSLLALGLVPEIKIDTTRKFLNIEELQQQLTVMRTQLAVIQTNPDFKPPELRQEREPEKKDEKLEIKEEDIVPLQVSALTQYTQNTVSNRGNVSLEIIGDDGGTIVSVPAGGSRSFTLGGQRSVTYRQGSQSKTVSTKDNSKPKLSLQRLVPVGPEASLRNMQSQVGYRVTLSDDYPGQLEVKITGPVTVKQASSDTYDVTLNFLQSKSAFDRYTENKEPPFTVTFQVIVKDKVAPHNIQQSGVYQFGEW